MYFGRDWQSCDLEDFVTLSALYARTDIELHLAGAVSRAAKAGTRLTLRAAIREDVNALQNPVSGCFDELREA